MRAHSAPKREGSFAISAESSAWYWRAARFARAGWSRKRARDRRPSRRASSDFASSGSTACLICFHMSSFDALSFR